MRRKSFTSKSVYGFDGTTPVRWIGTYIRADFLREKMDTDSPGELCVFFYVFWRVF